MRARRIIGAMITGVCLWGGAAFAQQSLVGKDAFTDEMPIIGVPVYSYPEKTPPTSAVVLFSDKDGWGEREKATAQELVAQGALVIGVDTPAALKKIAEQSDACVEIIGEIENVSHNTQYQMNTPRYNFPVVSGIGMGGALALAVAGQTESATIDRFAVVDPAPVLPSSKPLCTLDQPAAQPNAGKDGFTYHLSTGPKPFSVSFTLTQKADADMQDYAASWVAANPKSTTLSKSSLTQEAALLAAIRSKPASGQARAGEGGAEDVRDLPLVEMPVKTPSDTMAIFYSGDGGWRDLDKDLSEILVADGLPVVGVDVLRYFWNEQTPQQSAKDLARIIRSYRQKWQIKNVVLIGFSFGADLLPILYNQLPRDERGSIVQISLLGLSHAAVFEVSMESWLSHKPKDAPLTLPQVAKIKPDLIQCFYGEEDKENVCSQLSGTGVELIQTKGGHHFDGNYQGLAKKVLASLKKKTQKDN